MPPVSVIDATSLRHRLRDSLQLNSFVAAVDSTEDSSENRLKSDESKKSPERNQIHLPKGSLQECSSLALTVADELVIICAGSKTIEGLALDKRMLQRRISKKPLPLKTSSLAKMDKLKLLQHGDVELNGSYNDFPELRWLCWQRCHLEKNTIWLIDEHLGGYRYELRILGKV